MPQRIKVSDTNCPSTSQTSHGERIRSGTNTHCASTTVVLMGLLRNHLRLDALTEIIGEAVDTIVQLHDTDPDAAVSFAADAAEDLALSIGETTKHRTKVAVAAAWTVGGMVASVGMASSAAKLVNDGASHARDGAR
jgi:hypothetical protein